VKYANTLSNFLLPISSFKMTNARSTYRAAVIGASSGGWNALKTILGALPEDFPLAIMVVMHRHPHSDDYLEKSLDNDCAVRIKQADEKESIISGTVYFAPPNYHLLIEDIHTLSLSVARAVNYARPSIDVLFESAAYVYGDTLAGLILTGANNDGAGGLKKIKDMGGLVLVQDPETAEATAMPRAAIAATDPDFVLPLGEIGAFLKDLVSDS
jgi:two-component system, chemotaxis family, protein-glutamate methylesterase/glutaminase